jgi:(p)ppGpp synthase/HD superfamily hydrolase
MSFDKFVNDQELIKAAKQFATKCHKGQLRKFTKEPYIQHPQSVSELVEKFGGSTEMIAAAWLHDVVEDCGIKIKEIKNRFGDQVSKLVDELTLPKEVDISGMKSEYIAKKMETMSTEGLTIKLCDRLNNVSDFENANPKFVSKYAPKTKFIIDSLEESGRPFTSNQKKLINLIRNLIEPYLKELQ